MPINLFPIFFLPPDSIFKLFELVPHNIDYLYSLFNGYCTMQVCVTILFLGTNSAKTCPVAIKLNGQELYIDSGDQVNTCNNLYLAFCYILKDSMVVSTKVL